MENGVQANYTNLLTSYTEVKTQQKQVELANQNYAVVQNRYQNELAVRSRKMQSAVVTEQGHHLSASEQGIELARRAVDLARPLPSMRHPRRPHKHPESPPLVSLRHRLSSEEKVKKSKTFKK